MTFKKAKPITPDKRIHTYVLVNTDGSIDTLRLKRHPKNGQPTLGTIAEALDDLGLDGHQTLSKDLIVYWRDAGSMDGSSINKRVSAFLGFTCYGPVIFGRPTVYSDGLSEDQHRAINEKLQSAKDHTPEELETAVKFHLGKLELIPLEQFAAMDLDTFNKLISVSGECYGAIRQIGDAARQQQYVKRLNAIRKTMRSACQQRRDERFGQPLRITIAYHAEEAR